MMIDSKRLTMNDDMALSTRSGWKNTFSTVIPAGNLSIVGAMTLSIAAPTFGTTALFSRATISVSEASLPT